MPCLDGLQYGCSKGLDHRAGLSSFSRKFYRVLQGFHDVPEVGLEPTLPGGNRILSPARLPIPPLRQAGENRDYSTGHTHDRFVDKEKRAWR